MSIAVSSPGNYMPLMHGAAYLAFTRVYPEVSELAAWSENCKWYRSVPLDTVVPLFCESGLVSFAAINLLVASQRVFIVVYFVSESVRKLLDTHLDMICHDVASRLQIMGRMLIVTSFNESNTNP
jgi:hypothetical protein